MTGRNTHDLYLNLKDFNNVLSSDKESSMRFYSWKMRTKCISLIYDSKRSLNSNTKAIVIHHLHPSLRRKDVRINYLVSSIETLMNKTKQIYVTESTGPLLPTYPQEFSYENSSHVTV